MGSKVITLKNYSHTEEILGTRLLVSRSPYCLSWTRILIYRADKHDIILYCVSSIPVTTLTFINPRRMRSEGYSTWSVIPSVCLSVTMISATTHNKAAKNRYQRVECHTGLILKMAIYVLYCVQKLWCEHQGNKPIC